MVVCTRDRPAILDRCLQAIARLDHAPTEIIVVDSAPRDDAACHVAERWGARYLVEPLPGASRARNRGAHAAAADVVALLDDEAVPEPGWLPKLLDEFRDPAVMAVAGRILGLEVESPAERLFEVMGGFDCGPERRVVDRGSPNWFERASFGGIGNGGNVAFRRRAFDIWPGYHERLGPGMELQGGEEHYAFFSLADLGYRVVYTPFAVVRHPYPHTMEQVRQRYLRELTSSTAYMTFLLREQPRYRRQVLRYIKDGIKGTPRLWRGVSQVRQPKLVPGWKWTMAALFGPLVYVLSQLRETRGETQPAQA